MTAEEIKKEIERMQDVTKDIKTMVGYLRSDINKLEGAIKQDNDEFEARLAEAESRGFQKGYEKGFAEGCKWGADDNEIRVGDEVVVNGLTGVVMRLDEKGNVDRYFTSDGRTFGNISGFQNNEVIKTGRHFPEVEKILEAMRT